MFKFVFKGILAGVMVGLACFVYLNIDSVYVGAVLFSLALITIVTFDFNLFTGKVGYIPIKDKKYAVDTLLTLLYNMVGAFIIGNVIAITGNEHIGQTTYYMVDFKMSKSIVDLFIMAVFCGILMFVAVEGYAKTKNYIMIVLPIAMFILSGFEHSIADAVYFSIILTWKAIPRLMIIILGNAIGAMIIPLCTKTN